MQAENPYSRQGGQSDDLNALVGKTLGKFRIVERIGAGGMATVFKAYQPNLDRYVAIKVLPPYYARDETFVKRFVQEALSVAKLQHPNIVKIHDFGEQDNITYIVMEYVDGGTLKDRLKQQRVTVPEAVDYMIQAAQGLASAHRHGIVHRDVKPANMLLHKDGYLLLSDFGIAKILEGTAHLTRAGVGIGTPQYMSPEQGTGQPVDHRSDIYSLGIVLFHCLTGRVPFTADNPLTITVKHLNEPLPVDVLRMANVPAPIEQVVVKMTAKAPQDRYQSTETLIDALSKALADSHLSMPRPGSRSMIGGVAAVPFAPPPDQQKQEVTLSCFRCGASNPSIRLFCTTCGYELADPGAINDRYMGPNGRPILARLTIQNAPNLGRSYRFHQDVTTIGRTNGNDLIIAGRTVSRRHARLWFDNGRWFLEDLQSANGTLVNNQRIYQPVALNDGDLIQFGDEVVRFSIIY